MGKWIPEEYRVPVGEPDEVARVTHIDSRIEPFYRDLIKIMKKHGVHVDTESGYDWWTVTFDNGEAEIDVANVDMYFAINHAVGYNKYSEQDDNGE